MKKQLLSCIALLLVISVAGCTDAERASFSSLGNEADVTCFSGGQVVYKDVSTGKVLTGGGLYYKSETTGRYVKNYADCIVVVRK
jgi:uncharacterized lipoprotein YehR (DUF1307 family)